MNPRKTENVQLENLLSEYFRSRSFFPYGAIRDDKSSIICNQDNTVHQKYSNNDDFTFEFKTFCSMTSLHGFIHIVENKFNRYEKWFWAICLLAIYGLCGVAIYMLIFMFWEMPAIISLDNSVSSVWTLPFPAVTVCSANRARLSVYNYTLADVNNIDPNDKLIRNTMYDVCEKYPPKKNSKFTAEFLDGPSVSKVLKGSIAIPKGLCNLSFTCEEIVKSFYWLRTLETDPCNLWFQETYTSYGLCHSFNMMPMGDLLNGMDEWSLENNHHWKNYESSWHPDTGYSENALVSHLPIRTFGDKDYHSATMQLDFHTNDSNQECAKGLDVFYILIHSPGEWPDKSHPTLLGTVGTLMTTSVKPVVVTTSNYLRNWDPELRSCYFQNEKKLKFFKVYTQKNCLLECRTDLILTHCGCVPFHHFRIKNTPVCGPAKISCWETISHISLSPCNCLPGCNEFSFKISSMNAQFNTLTQESDESVSISSMVLLSVYYQHKNYIGLNRIMTFTFSQFMGNVGGIMGLCLGFSFLSLAEIVYFLTLRPFVNLCNTKRKRKQINPIYILE